MDDERIGVDDIPAVDTMRVEPATSRELAGPWPTSDELGAMLVTTDERGENHGYLPELIALSEPEHDPAPFAATVQRLLPELGRLTAPLAQLLRQRGEVRVTLVPCGPLGLLPLHAATYDRNNDTVSLGDEFSVAYAPSARVLVATQPALTRRDASPTLAGVANPSGTQPPLDRADAELTRAATLFSRAYPLHGAAATAANLLTVAKQASHVHLACHAQSDLAYPPNSYFELAFREHLTMHDILANRDSFANARLVVASACSTSVVDFNNLPDEASGLYAAFLHAGVPAVVGTLWPARDAAALALMSLFYHFHRDAGLEPAEALAHSQRVLAGKAAMPAGLPWRIPSSYRSPYFWAGFVLFGH